MEIGGKSSIPQIFPHFHNCGEGYSSHFTRGLNARPQGLFGARNWEEQPMHKFRAHVETDGEGSSWWCDDNFGFVAVASTLPELKLLINEWVEDEGIGEFELLMGVRRELGAAAAGRSRRYDISERIEETLANEAAPPH
jgi:hypothetical protein